MSGTLRRVIASIVWGETDPRIRASWRIVLAFAILFGVYLGVSTVRKPQQRLPDILLNGAGAFVVFGAVAVVLFVSIRFLDASG